MIRRLTNSRGQSLVEFAFLMPLILTVALGVIEVGYALLDQHVITKLTREGSNLISRDTTIQDAETAMQTMATRPVDFSTTASRLIFSVLRKGATTGTANYNQIILYQRHAIGGLTGVSSKLTTRGSGSFSGAPDYVANNSDTDTNLQLNPVPANLQLTPGGLLYVTEIYSSHPLITPLDRFGVTVPSTLYSIAFF
jgi:Flp pilus assembly protein TadG